VIGQKTTIILTKLIPSTKYFLKIKARIDWIKLGPLSDVIEFITKPSLPHSHTSSSKPKILEVVPRKDSSVVEIIWRAPEEPKERIIGYEIYYTSDEQIKQNTEWNMKLIEYIEDIDDINDVEQIRTSIYDLLSNTNYKFLIKVKTSEDNVGPISSIFEFLTEPLINKNYNLKIFLGDCVKVFELFGRFVLRILICFSILLLFCLNFSFIIIPLKLICYLIFITLLGLLIIHLIVALVFGSLFFCFIAFIYYICFWFYSLIKSKVWVRVLFILICSFIAAFNFWFLISCFVAFIYFVYSPLFGYLAVYIWTLSLISFSLLYPLDSYIESKQNEAEAKRTEKNNENITREGLTI
jgi:hypothetical protein